MDKKQDPTAELRAGLEALDIGTLRNRASKNFGIKLTRDHSKNDIIDLIISVVSKNNFAEAADGEIRPGYSRIKIMPVAGKVTFPIWFNCNDYFGFIPVGIEVDVPTKVVEILNHAEEIRKTKNEYDEYVDSFELSYPFQVLGSVPGPDPRPGREKVTQRKWEPYIKFQKKFGFWPSGKVLQQATASSMQFSMFDDKAAEE